MNIRNIITRSLSGLLIITIVYMHIGSAHCGLNSLFFSQYNTDNSNDYSKYSCSKNEEKKGHDQPIHFSFFYTVGQYHFNNSTNVLKALTSIIAVPYYHSNNQILTLNKGSIPFNSHSPPPRENIRVFIQSFLV
jgi:hypothetical protein